MNNTIWKEFIESLYNGFHNTTEVMTLIGFRSAEDELNGREDIVEYVEYYTSHEASTVVGNFRDIVKAMSKYTLLRGKDAKFMLVHNHPAGTPEASESDVTMTKRFQVACALLGTESVGSYIYIEGGEVVLIGGLTEELTTPRIRISNQYTPNGTVSVARLGVQRLEAQVQSHFTSLAVMGASLSEEVLDMAIQREWDEPYKLVELDAQNRLLAIYSLNKLQPRIEGATAVDLPYRKGMAMVFRRDASRYVVYDKRVNTERDSRGLATDTKEFITAMGIVGYPINFYVG